MATSPRFLSTGSIELTLQRRGPGRRVNGYWVEDVDAGYGSGYGSSMVDVTFRANVQPGLTKNDMMLLPEGERSRKSLRVYTTFELRARREGPDGHDADRFEYDGEIYEVMVVPPAYKMGVLNHTKAICCRMERT